MVETISVVDTWAKKTSLQVSQFVEIIVIQPINVNSLEIAVAVSGVGFQREFRGIS